jgi:O-antigen/teichoic acid export membrane protein
LSLKKNILANYLSQAYAVLIGVAMVPLYIEYMGAEAYGLVGFFTMLQVWFCLLDLGLSSSLARETARFNGGALSAIRYRGLVRALEIIFFIVGLLAGCTLFGTSNFIARDWLQASELDFSEVLLAVQLMAIITALRWMCGLYRGIISGFEKILWLSGFTSIIASLRFLLVLPVLVFVGVTPTLFFGFQLVAALIEFVVIFYYAHRLLPDVPRLDSLLGNSSELRPIFRFSLSIAFTSSVWVVVTQTDKLILSRLLTLAEYGYFTLSVVTASVVMMISGPISGAIMPRMSRMEAEGKQAGLIALYRQATQIVVVAAGALSLTLALGSESLLWIWTGDHALAQHAAPVLALYALGNGVLVIASFPYYLQYAKGDLRLHLIGNVLFVLTLTPVIIWATNIYGALGAGAVWLGINLLSFVAWLPLVHRKFEPGLNRKWYFEDILTILVPMLLLALPLQGLVDTSASRAIQTFWLALIGAALLGTGLIFSSFARNTFQGKASKLFNA